MRRFWRWGVMWMLATVLLPARAEQLQIAVAANFLGTLQKLAPDFERASGHTLVLSGGASGQFYSQITHGAPFDIFLSADAERPRQLEQDGLTVPGSRFTYAIGKLALWSPQPGVVDAQGAVLKSGRYRFIAIANPRVAPYGAAARQVLEKQGLWETLNADKKLVMGESIAQALQYVTSGNAELGFVAWAQVIGDKEKSGSIWLPPQTLYDPIVQDAVILKSTLHRAAAEQFMRWLRGDAHALAVIQAAGYSVGAAR
jgi:molybdate transport system substrate-binding protein